MKLRPFRIMAKVWRGWLKLAEIIGNFQMTVILSVIYWTMVAVLALPFRLFADPLAQKGSHQRSWVRRAPVEDVAESAKKQG